MELSAPLIFILIAIAIVVLALALTRAFRNTIQSDKRFEDPNGDRRDGDGVATWSGVDHDP